MPAKRKEANVVLLRAREARRRRFIRWAAHVALAPRHGIALRAWRADHNMSQREFAALFGISARSVIRLERRQWLPVAVALAIEGR